MDHKREDRTPPLTRVKGVGRQYEQLSSTPQLLVFNRRTFRSRLIWHLFAACAEFFFNAITFSRISVDVLQWMQEKHGWSEDRTESIANGTIDAKINRLYQCQSKISLITILRYCFTIYPGSWCTFTANPGRGAV